MGLLYFTSMLLACNTASDKRYSRGTKASVENHEHSEKIAGLVLNNGAKWKADSNTRNNVMRLKTTIDMFKAQHLSPINDYQLLGKDLSDGLDILIQQCKMKGEEHEVLHKWLEPVLYATNQLKDITDTSIARQVFDSVDKRINNYSIFFE